MAENESKNIYIKPTDITFTEQGVVMEGIAQADSGISRENVIDAIDEFRKAVGSTGAQFYSEEGSLIENRGKIPEDTGKRSFGFSSKTWKSPWNPQGPKPNWEVKNKNPKDN